MPTRNQGLFASPRHKWIAKIITFEDPGRARRAADTLLTSLQRGKYRRLRIGPRRALSIARALQYAANRARASAKRRNLTKKERRELERISKIYDRAADKAWKIYDKRYKR